MLSSDAVPGHGRASDADRERVIGALREASVTGRLSHDTFVRRVDLALHARVSDQLEELLHDLPRPERRPAHPVVRAFNGWFGIVAQLRTAWKDSHLPRLAPPRATRPVFTVGRAQECDLRLSHRSVSRRHAELRRIGHTWVLVDLDSTNGTRANGWRAGSGLVVRSGNKVTFGHVTFRFEDDG